MASRTWIPGAIAAAALMALLSAPAHAQRASVTVQIAPPAAQVEVIPTVPRGQVWVPGHWRWNGSQHVWVPGRMTGVRRGYVWAPDRWVQVNGRWEFREGVWVRPGVCNDTDGNGVCDRFDDRSANNRPTAGPARVYVQVPPPPPRVEPVPAVRRGQVWVPGYWRWDGRQHVWVAGKYNTRRSGYVWAPDRWVQVDGRWEFREGVWVRPGVCNDTDGNGVCDRFDNDRDGDGVPNRQDARPNDPNRR